MKTLNLIEPDGHFNTIYRIIEVGYLTSKSVTAIN